MKFKFLVALCLFLLCCALTVQARSFPMPASDEPPLYEFRGAWIATVAQLDWPRGAGTEAQKASLVELLDRLKAAGINAVFFQIRPAADALYASSLEPWSHWLTGAQGKAPEPFYDPLQFAIEETHRRGMELHAWFNPYRAVNGAYPLAPEHVAVEHPEWILTFGDTKLLNPGIPAVRDYVISVVRDVVDRYDVDGVHFDDYFYPYSPHITSEDQATYQEFGGSFSSIDTWRRYNVNMLVRGVHEMIETVRPRVKFGISPFGIWKSGTPAGTSGLSAYDAIYADAVNWLDQQWIDYVVPQLYWSFAGGQDYAKLAPWWASVRNERHLYTGHGLYKADAATFSGTLYPANEVPRQVRFNREHPDIQGSVFFRARNLTTYPSKGFADSLKNDLFRYPALTPPMEWKDLTPPGTPQTLLFEWTGEDAVTLRWQAPVDASGEAEARFYAVFRVRSERPPDFAEVVLDARNLLAVTGDTLLTDRPGIASQPYYYAVAAVSANSVLSNVSNAVALEGKALSAETSVPTGFRLYQNYPNPFNPSTRIRFDLDRPANITLRIYNVLGQTVRTLILDIAYARGSYVMEWNGADDNGLPVSSGTYLYALDADGRREAELMALVK